MSTPAELALDAALRYVTLGYRVLPARVDPTDGKRKPPVGGTVDVAAGDPDAVREIWRLHPWPHVMLFSPPGTLAVDLDRGHDDGVDGVASLAALAPPGEPFNPETWHGPIARSPRGGLHLYGRDPRPAAQWGWTRSMLGPGVETKANRRQITTPVDGSGDGRGWLRPLVRPEDLPTFPEWLAPLLDRQPLPPRPPRPASGDRSSSADRAWAEVILHEESRLVAECAPGSRVVEMNKRAFKLGQICHYLNEAEVEGALVAAAEANGLMGDNGERETMTAIRKAIRDGQRNPRYRPENDVETRRHATQTKARTMHSSPKGSPQDRSPKPKASDLSDLDLAHRWIEEVGDRFIFCKQLGTYFEYDGKRYRTCVKNEERASANDFVTRLHQRYLDEYADALHEAADAKVAFEANKESPDVKNVFERARSRVSSAGQLLHLAKRACDAPHVNALLHLASGEPLIAVAALELDSDPMIFNCTNGALDLRTMQLLPHSPEQRLSKVSGAPYEPLAEAPLFEKFLREVLPDPDVRAYLQRIIGAALLGESKPHVLPILYGDGENGKSTFVETIAYVFGDYAVSLTANEIAPLERHDAHPTGIMDLKGARFAFSQETEKGATISAAKIKALTGGDRIKARRMHKDFVEFPPTHTLFLSTNHKPRILDQTAGMWRRIRLLGFTEKFPEEKADRTLKEKLRIEASGILRWAADGLIAFIALGQLKAPAAVLDATVAYREQEDLLDEWLRDYCERDIAAKTKLADLVSSFNRWAEDSEIKTRATSQSLNRWFDERGFPSACRVGGYQTRTGIRLLSPVERCAQSKWRAESESGSAEQV